MMLFQILLLQIIWTKHNETDIFNDHDDVWYMKSDFVNEFDLVYCKSKSVVANAAELGTIFNCVPVTYL